MASEKVVALVYLLLRDHLPAGTVTRLVGEAQSPEEIGYGHELGALAYRLADVLDDDDVVEPEKETDERAADLLQAVEAGGDGGYSSPTGEELSDDMVDFLDLFDDRLRQSPHFVAAVNEAAANGMHANEDTAALVGARIREMKAQADAAAAADGGKA